MGVCSPDGDQYLQQTLVLKMTYQLVLVEVVLSPIIPTRIGAILEG